MSSYTNYKFIANRHSHSVETKNYDMRNKFCNNKFLFKIKKKLQLFFPFVYTISLAVRCGCGYTLTSINSNDCLSKIFNVL